MFTVAFSDQVYNNLVGWQHERETDLYISLVLGFEVGVSLATISFSPPCELLPFFAYVLTETEISHVSWLHVCFISYLAPWMGKMKHILHCDRLLESTQDGATCILLAQDYLLCPTRQLLISQMLHNESFTGQPCLVKIFSIGTQKKNLTNSYPSWPCLVNNPYIN